MALCPVLLRTRIAVSNGLYLTRFYLWTNLKGILRDKLAVAQCAAFYFTLARRYSQLNCIPKTIELLEKSIALKTDDEAISFLSETRYMLNNLMQKKKGSAFLFEKGQEQ